MPLSRRILSRPTKPLFEKDLERSINDGWIQKGRTTVEHTRYAAKYIAVLEKEVDIGGKTCQ